MTSGTLKEMVRDSVLLSIINGEYTVETVISEKKLAEKMQVSKAPVRDALIELCCEGVLRSVPRIGYMVVRFDDRNMREMLQYRTLLECGCLEQCFDQITPTQLRRLENVVDGEFLFLSCNDPRDYWNHTLNFHLTLASFSENEFIYNRLNSVLKCFMRAYLQLHWDDCRNNELLFPPRLHREIVEAIRLGDKAGAVEKLRSDLGILNSLDGTC